MAECKDGRYWLVSTYNQNPREIISVIDEPYLVCNQGDESWLEDELKKTGSWVNSFHSGHNISDYLEFIIKNYDALPESIGFIKGNIFPRHISKECFLARKINNGFVPLYGDSCTYKHKNHHIFRWKLIAQQVAPGYYSERTNNWYVKHKKKGTHFPLINDLFTYLFNRKAPQYITFVPGACMIVPREKILRWDIEVYKKLYEAVTYELFPVEAYHVERCMLYLFDFPKV